jgi:hypothetical protein
MFACSLKTEDECGNTFLFGRTKSMKEMIAYSWLKKKKFFMYCFERIKKKTSKMFIVHRDIPLLCHLAQLPDGPQ